MHIAIEGMDGVGKSTVGKLLAQKLNYKFVEKPLGELFGADEYIKIRDKVNLSSNRFFTSWFYGLSNIYLYEKFGQKNLVTDRHLASNYAWSSNSDNQNIYSLLVDIIKKPYLTVILYAKAETIEKRLKNRDTKDSDLKKIAESETIYEKMIDFCEKYDFSYLKIATDNLDPDLICKKILDHLSALQANG